MVETVNKWKTAHVLDRHWGLGEREEPLRVLVQVNTSGEASQWVTSHHTVTCMGWSFFKYAYSHASDVAGLVSIVPVG